MEKKMIEERLNLKTRIDVILKELKNDTTYSKMEKELKELETDLESHTDKDKKTFDEYLQIASDKKNSKEIEKNKKYKEIYDKIEKINTKKKEIEDFEQIKTSKHRDKINEIEKKVTPSFNIPIYLKEFVNHSLGKWLQN